MFTTNRIKKVLMKAGLKEYEAEGLVDSIISRYILKLEGIIADKKTRVKIIDEVQSG